MSAGGDGIIDFEPLIEVARPNGSVPDFIPRRFEMGGRLKITDAAGIQDTPLKTCVLCGGLILDHESSMEHPLPQWLHRYCEDAGEMAAPWFETTNRENPTWRQLCLRSHKICNSTFDKKIERPAKSSIHRIFEGKNLTWSDIDSVFDWLDKVKSSSAHMATAIKGHGNVLSYSEISFPNKRVGAFDRIAIFFRISDYDTPLDMWECFSDGFLTTPSSIILRIKDLIIVYISSNYVLSAAFGLGIPKKIDGELAYVSGNSRPSDGFGTRKTRIPAAKILAQPMRRQHQKAGYSDTSTALQPNGDGRIYELSGGKWNRIKSINFSNLPILNSRIGLSLAGLESIEWLILTKEQDYEIYGQPGAAFIKSLPSLQLEKLALMGLLFELRNGLPMLESDRI